MSFFIVPTMLYQQKQKMAKGPKKHARSPAAPAPPKTSKTSKTPALAPASTTSVHSTASSAGLGHMCLGPPRHSVHDDRPGAKHAHNHGLARRSASSQLLMPSQKSRRSSLASGVSWHLTSAGLIPSFSPPKSGENHWTGDVRGQKQDYVVPEFQPFIDPTVLDSEDGVRSAFLNPAFMLANFAHFLAGLSDNHVNDPINFATVRDQSLRKFLTRRNVGLDSHWATELALGHGDRQRIEDLLTHELLRCRSIARTRVKLRLAPHPHFRPLASEQLVQANFVNYVRYILTLPECSARQALGLSEDQKRDYDVRRAFCQAADALYALKRDNYEGGILTALPRMDLLLQSITKTAVDFVLLEKYAVQILAKLNNDFLIESRITRHLFKLHHLNLQLGKQESVKVLLFNSTFSCAYSWQLAVTIPFVRVFEASVLGETQLPPDSDKRVSCYSLKEGDPALYQNYFSRLGFLDFAAFQKLGHKDLVALQRSLADNMAPGNTPVKPVNFEYYARPLATIQLETFHMIQCRDLRSQVAPENIETILFEFHRLLKSGGVLELPMIFCALGESGFNLSEKSHSKQKKPDWLETYTFDAMNDMITILGSLFGASAVKFSAVLLTQKNKMISFLIKYTEMAIYELFSEINQFHQFTEVARGLDVVDENDLHFYLYLRAEKA